MEIVVKTHGHSARKTGSRSPTYNSWRAMIQRCRDPNNWQYPDYGGRGIRVCDEWLRFEGFLADMGERPAARFIERIDNERGYEPGNCRWASRTDQNRNRRNTKLSEETVVEIRRRRATGEVLRTIAADFGVSMAMVSYVARGEAW